MTSLEGAVTPVAAESIEAKVNPEKEVPKCDDSEKANEKEPETPVTEPLTNGSSAPETPKEEIRQNGDSASVEEQPSALEIASEVKAPEVQKVEEKVETPAPVEIPEVQKPAEEPVADVDSIPMNGLKIEETVADEVKPPAEVEVPQETQKIEEVINTSVTVAEPVEEKSAVIPDAEVCVEKEKPETVGNVEVPPPPLPSSPPPSSLTMFAESTMAPLVDTQNVETLPVNVDASISSLSSLDPVVNVKDELQSTPNDTVAPLVCEVNPVNNLPSPLTNETAESSQTSLLLPAQEISSDPNVPEVTDAVSRLTLENNVCEIQKSDLPPIVDNVAVVSSEVDTPNPAEVLDNLPLPPESNVDSPLDFPEPLKDNSSFESDIPVNSSLPLDPLDESTKTVPPSFEDIPPVNEVVPSNISAMESAVLQKAPSDQDISETTLADQPSDSFPPPPPPESCPESMTELSVSESLPPPMSEFSVPDAILNSPTSETVELPCKDETPLKDVEIPEVKDSEAVEEPPKPEVQVTEKPSEVNGLPAMEAAEAFPFPPAEPTQPQLQEISKETPQVKTVSEVADVPVAAPDPAAAAVSSPSADPVAE